MLSILALGMLVAVGAAFDGTGYESAPHGGDRHGGDHGGDHGSHDFGGHRYNDWLNPGGYSYTYNWVSKLIIQTTWYPTYTTPIRPTITQRQRLWSIPLTTTTTIR